MCKNGEQLEKMGNNYQKTLHMWSLERNIWFWHNLKQMTFGFAISTCFLAKARDMYGDRDIGRLGRPYCGGDALMGEPPPKTEKWQG